MNELAEYKTLIEEIKELIHKSQYEALKTVNTVMLKLYWEIGEEICNQQKERGWGKSIVEVLSKELQKEFPGVRGYSARNLWRMRNFYSEYSVLPNLPPLVAEISWAKNIIIIEKCKDELEREFYIKSTKKFGWTKDVLINNVENKTYEKYLLNQTNFDESLPEKYRHQAKFAIKDEYSFDFLDMGEEHNEAELERSLVGNIREFLTELGGTYSFIGNQYHLSVGETDYYIDLLLFHRKLKSLVALELKIGEFKPEYAGKMQFYLTALDEKLKLPDENPSIGIIICKSKDRTVVEYALRTAVKPMGVSTYSISTKLPNDFKNLLPSPEEIKERLELFEEL